MYWKLEKKENFYDTLVKMWEEHNFPVMPYQRVANRIFVAYGFGENNEPIVLYAVQVYITDSTMCQIAFPTSNKNAPKELKKREVLESLIDIIQVCMKYEGFDFIYTTSENPKLMEIFSGRGFQPSDEGVTYYSKPL